MATFDYDEMRVTADELLQEFGTTATLYSRAVGTYNPSTQSVSGDNETPFSVYACFVPWDSIYIDGKKYEWNNEYKFGTGVRLDEVRCLLSAQDISGDLITPPKQGDRLIVNGQEFQIIELKSIQPALIPVLFDCKLRK